MQYGFQLRAFGWVMGQLLYVLAAPRRRVASINLRLCLPQQSERERRALAQAITALELDALDAPLKKALHEAAARHAVPVLGIR